MNFYDTLFNNVNVDSLYVPFLFESSKDKINAKILDLYKLENSDEINFIRVIQVINHRNLLKFLKNFTYASFFNKKETECIISLEHKNCLELKCCHCVSEKCLNNWLIKKNECPMCRQKILEDKFYIDEFHAEAKDE